MLNVKKTKIMTTGTLNVFILDKTEIGIINCYTFLGTIITQKLMAMTKLEKNYEGSGREYKLPKLK
jgi:hypothetical protein